MSNQSVPLSQFESSPGLKFEAVGDKHVGRIINIEQRQQTDPKTGLVKCFSSGDPMMQWVITIEKETGETGTLYAKGGRYQIASGVGQSMQAAIAQAIKEGKANSLDVGAQLAVAWTGEGKASGPGMNPPKLYTAQYQPPAPASVPVDLFSPPQ
jgi:hypothetical protein